MRAVTALVCLIPGTAFAGLLDIFRKREPEPEPEALTIFGLDVVAMLPVLLTVVAIGLLIKYRPRFIMEVLRGALGDLLAWIVAVLVVFAFVFMHVLVYNDLGVIGAVIMSVVIVLVVIIGSFLGS